ncbi:MAG: hypothetical protein LUC88_10495 [Prevotella sp.]|nr:hypothetical protein [Prevotella sp.]
MEKKIIIVSAIVAILALLCVASGDYESVLSISMFLGLIFAVLQIILFFKIWNMTKDVKNIADKMKEKEINENNPLKAILKGDNEKAKDILVNDCINDLIQFAIKGVDAEELNKIRRAYGLTSNYEIQVKHIKIYYETALKNLGGELPDKVKLLTHSDDVLKLLEYGKIEQTNDE